MQIIIANYHVCLDGNLALLRLTSDWTAKLRARRENTMKTGGKYHKLNY